MTLITYLTRVHFADNVLEEALWSELESNNKRSALVLIDRNHLRMDHIERFLSGIPNRVKVSEYTSIPSTPDEETVRDAVASYNANNCDVIVACGSTQVINLGKAMRIAVVHDEPLATFTYENGGSSRISPDLPDLIATPDINGFGSAVNAHAPFKVEEGKQGLLICKKLIPTASICDPTLTLGVNSVESASAGADTIAQCVEAYLSNSYNPPAEGIALDGLRRAVNNIDKVLEDLGNLTARREMMAASLNGALALQKGLGACQAIANALAVVCATPNHSGVLNRVALPGVLNFNRPEVECKYASLRPTFRISEESDFVDGVQKFLSHLPLPGCFSELGISESELEDAAQIAAIDLACHTNPRKLGRDDFLSIMKSVH